MEETLIGDGAADTENTGTEPQTEAETGTLIGDGKDEAQGDGKGTLQTENKAEESKEEPSTDWTLEVPAGADAEMVSRTEQVCKAKGWTKQQAADLVEIQQQERAAFREMHKGWVSEIKADADFGGEHMDTTIANANIALSRLDPTGEVRQILNQTQYADHPAVLRLLARAGAAYREDKIIPGHGGDSRPLEDRLYTH